MEEKKDISTLQGRARRKEIKMRLQPSSVLNLDESEDHVEVAKLVESRRDELNAMLAVIKARGRRKAIFQFSFFVKITLIKCSMNMTSEKKLLQEGLEIFGKFDAWKLSEDFQPPCNYFRAVIFNRPP